MAEQVAQRMWQEQYQRRGYLRHTTFTNIDQQLWGTWSFQITRRKSGQVVCTNLEQKAEYCNSLPIPWWQQHKRLQLNWVVCMKWCRRFCVRKTCTLTRAEGPTHSQCWLSTSGRVCVLDAWRHPKWFSFPPIYSQMKPENKERACTMRICVRLKNPTALSLWKI